MTSVSSGLRPCSLSVRYHDSIEHQSERMRGHIDVKPKMNAEHISKQLELGSDPLRLDARAVPATIAHADCQVEAALVLNAA